MRKRDHGGVVFVDLRDHYGVTQVVFNEHDKETIQDTRVESVIKVSGEVLERAPELVNPKIPTGKIEVHCKDLEILSPAEVLPFQIAEEVQSPESMRLKQRFLELRRDALHSNIARRSEIVQGVRDIMHSMNFKEFHTPILTSSSPEGARDYIVPSRRHAGKFYALPQAPQQFKQLIMVSGFDRYFQIAPCFRDEDARADRSPGEFYQIDMELSFVGQEEVFAVNENLMHTLFTRCSGAKVDPTPFQRIRYEDSVARYGNDKPDLRNPLVIKDVSSVFKGCGFKVFSGAIEQGGSVQAIAVPLEKVPPRKYFDDTIEFFKSLSGQGVAYLSFDYTEGAGECKGSIQKFFTEEEIENLRTGLGIDKTHSIFFAAGATDSILPWLGRLRDKLGADFDLLEKNSFRFCWITDYPMYELDDSGKLDFGHNPFSMPQGGLEALNEKEPLDVYAHQYDLVCNGYELGSGAIRNHQPEVMYRAFEIVGYSKEEVDRQFGGMIRAFQFGAPPHGGIAHGLERIVMLLCGEQAIRDVIMFPLAQNGEDLMMGAPSEVRLEQLLDVHIRVQLPEELKKTG